jgi:mono/diheme cytochrome c family protein
MPAWIAAALLAAVVVTVPGAVWPAQEANGGASPGRAAFERACARCHGADGRGDPEIKKTMPNVRDFHDPQFLGRATNDSILTVMMAGKGQMPAFGRSLSMPKMQALSGYVRRLGTGTSPPGGTH